MSHFKDLESHTLDNGTRVLILPESHHQLATAQVWYQVGSRCESPDIYGMSHFLEHLFFKGTVDMGPGIVDLRLNQLGAMNNAATSKDYTFYYVFGTADVLESMYSIQAQMLLNPALDPAEIDKERDVVIAEIRRANDNPAHQFYYQMMEQNFANHPYSHPVLGYEEIIRTVPREAIQSYYKQHYHSGSATVLLAGNLNRAQALKMVENSFGQLQKRTDWSSAPLTPHLATPSRRLTYARTHRNYSCLGFLGPDHTRLRDTLALDLLSIILTDQRSSRWTRELKEEQDLVESLSFSCHTSMEQSLISIYAIVKNNRFTAYHEAIQEALHRLRRFYVSREEIETARTQALYQSAHRLQKLSGRAQQLGFYATMNQTEYCTRHEELIRSISQEDMIRVIEKYLSSEPVVSQMLPESLNETATASIPTQPPRHSLQYEAQNLDSKTTEFRFQSGFRLIYQKQEAHHLASARLAAGSAAELSTRFAAGTPLIVHKLLTKGSNDQTAQQIAATMDTLGARYTTVAQGVQTSKEFYPSRLDAPAHAFWEAFEVFSGFFTNPDFLSEEFRKVRESALSDIASLEDHLTSYCLYNLMQNFFENHPFSIPALGTRESLEELTIKDLRDFHSLAYAAPNLTLVLGGPWEIEEVLQKVHSRFHSRLGSIEYRITETRVPQSLPHFKSGETHTVQNPKEQAYIMPAWPVSAGGTREALVGQVLNELLGGGMSSRFFRDMRDEKSYGYEIGSSLVQYASMGMFFCYLGTDPNRVEDAAADFQAHIQNVIQNTPQEEEVDKARKLILSRHAMSLETPSDRLAWLLRLYVYDRPLKWLEDYSKTLTSITPADVQAYARKFLDKPPFLQRIMP